MNPAILRRVLMALTCLWLTMGVPRVRADRFSWETSSSGNFTDPNRWHGPNFPDHTRFPGAGDDASIDRGPLTVTITGEQATRELVTGDPTLNIVGRYTVSQLSAYGSVLTITGAGQLDSPLWLMGAKSIVDGARATIETLQPLGAGQGPSELRVQGGGNVSSQALDRSRGGLRVVVEGPGSIWKHAAELPYVEIVIHQNGRVEVPSTDDVLLNADGGGALLTASGRFKGYGVIANGARLQSAEGLRSGGGNTTIDAGTWTVQNTFINDGGDLTVQNGGVLSARNVGPGQFSALTLVEGAGSRMEVASLLRHQGGIQLKRGGSLTCAEAQLDVGFVYAETGGHFSVSGDVFGNSQLNLINGGVLDAGGVLLADVAGRSGGMNVAGSGSVADLRGGLAVGQRGWGTLAVRDRGHVNSRSGGMGIFAGSHGDVTVSGALSAWSIRPSSLGGGLLVGDAGVAVLRVDSGGAVRHVGPAEAVVGRQSGGDGSVRLRDFGSILDVQSGSMVVGQGGRGTLELESAAQFLADRLIVGRSALENRVIVSGQDTLLGVTGELIVGDGGLGILQLRQGAQGVVRRLVVGRQSRADNRALIEGPETRLSGSDRIDVGEENGRGRLEMVDTAEARPGAGLSVGIYNGSDGTLLLDRKAFIVTSADAIFGGGVDSRAAATIRGGGSLDALDILIFAKPSGSATLDVTNQFSSIEAVRDLQIGFGRGPAGVTRMRADDGSFVSAGEALMVGIGGRLEVTGARVKVGAAEFPPPGTVRVGTGGRLRGSGRVKARVEVVAGGAVSPGTSPGTLTVEGNYTQQAGARLEIEISGTAAGSAYDVLQVSGAAALGGTLVIHFVDGFAPRTGQRFEFLKADGGMSGSFGSVEVTGVAPGFTQTVAAEGASGLSLVALNNGVATTVPELGIAFLDGSVVVSWAANGTWVLETTAGLSATWRAVTTAPILRDGRYVVTLPVSATTAFFRLRP